MPEHFTKDHLPAPDLCHEARKTATTRFAWLTEPFTVNTKEGKLEIGPHLDEWEDGYYLAIPNDGDPYPVSAKFVKDNYKFTERIEGKYLDDGLLDYETRCGHRCKIGDPAYFYDRYGSVTDWKNFQGKPMPAWEDLPEGIHKAWGQIAGDAALLDEKRHELLSVNPTRESRGLRKQLDTVLQRLKAPVSGRRSANRTLAIRHIEDAIMRLGMDLKDQREENIHDEPSPYAGSYDAASGKPIAPTADGLKL